MYARLVITIQYTLVLLKKNKNYNNKICSYILIILGMRISIPPLIPLFLIQSLASPCVDELYIFVAFITVSDNICQLAFYIIIIFRV